MSAKHPARPLTEEERQVVADNLGLVHQQAAASWMHREKSGILVRSRPPIRIGR
jgi:hypothetical protein